MRRRLSSLILFRSIPPRKCTSHTHRPLFSQTLISAKKSHQNNNPSLSKFYFSSSATYLGSNQIRARFSTQSTSTEEANARNDELEVEIIGEEIIKPATPTPQHLSIHEFSLIDRLYPNVYTPLVYFYPNNPKNGRVHLTLKVLRQSLSETLVRFYPFAGRINKDKTGIDCNDEGVHYVEAKVNEPLSDFLNNRTTNNKSVHQLLPLHPDSVELKSRTDILMAQVTTFTCGGIAIGFYPSHQILDAYSVVAFLKAWAATTRGSYEEICPTFVASSVFPPQNRTPNDKTTVFLPYFPLSKTVTRRLVFPASALATLKAKTGSSRVLSVAALLTKSLAAASSQTSKPKFTSLTITVNLRDKLNLPPYSIGNVILNSPPVICTSTTTGGDDDQESLVLDSIIQPLKESANKVNRDLVNKMNDGGFMEKSLKELQTFYSDNNAKHIFVSSACNSGMYEVDFGWGGPIWVNFALADVEIPTVENYVILMDTRSEKGIEAWINLAEEDMVVLERDPELLSLASINPSPLQPV